jgi:hypothetical protein
MNCVAASRICRSQRGHGRKRRPVESGLSNGSVIVTRVAQAISSRFTARRRVPDRPSARASGWDRIRASQTAGVADEENQTVAFARIAHRAPTLGTVAAIAIVIHRAILLLRQPLVNSENMATIDSRVRCEVRRGLLDVYDTETAAFAASVSLLHQSWERRPRSSTKSYDARSRSRESDQNRRGLALEAHTVEHGC